MSWKENNEDSENQRSFGLFKVPQSQLEKEQVPEALFACQHIYTSSSQGCSSTPHDAALVLVVSHCSPAPTHPPGEPEPS